MKKYEIINMRTEETLRQNMAYSTAINTAFDFADLLAVEHMVVKFNRATEPRSITFQSECGVLNMLVQPEAGKKKNVEPKKPSPKFNPENPYRWMGRPAATGWYKTSNETEKHSGVVSTVRSHGAAKKRGHKLLVTVDSEQNVLLAVVTENINQICEKNFTKDDTSIDLNVYAQNHVMQNFSSYSIPPEARCIYIAWTNGTEWKLFGKRYVNLENS